MNEMMNELRIFTCDVAFAFVDEDAVVEQLIVALHLSVVDGDQNEWFRNGGC